MGVALSSPWRASSSALSIGVVYYLYNIHYGKRKRPGGEFPTKPPKISNIPKLGRSLDKVIFMYAATSILGALTVMLSPLMVSLGLFYKIYSITKAIVEGEKKEVLTVQDILNRMTLEEKCFMMGGKTTFATSGCKRLGVPPLKFTDGPSGARGMAILPLTLLNRGIFADLPWISKKSEFQDPNLNSRSWWLKLLERYVPDALILGPGTFGTCCPCGTCLAATFDPKLAAAVGNLIGRDCKTKGASVILGPTMNLTRTPTGGRSFEAFGEDPYLGGIMGCAWVNGAQSVDGVAACGKHFACNEFEYLRMASDSRVNKRPLHELYLRHFEMLVKDAKVKCLMTGYNKTNGTYMCSNAPLLDKVLRNEWGFDGVVMSDWYGTHDTVGSAYGNLLDLEMPGPVFVRGQKLVDAVRSGKLPEDDIDIHVERILKLTENLKGKMGPGTNCDHSNERPGPNDPDDVQLLQKLSRESLVLLKNEGNVLPLPKRKNINITLYGPNAVNYSITGGGSVETLPPTPVTIETAFCEAFPNANVQVQDFTNVDLEVANGRNFTPFLVEVYDSPAHMDCSKHCLGQLVLEEGMLLCTTLRAITWSLIAPGIFPTAEYNKAGVKVSTKLKARADIPNNNKMSRHVFEFNASGPARLSIDGNIIVATPDIYSEPGVLGWRNFGMGCKGIMASIDLDDSIEHDIVIEWKAHSSFTENKHLKEAFASQMHGGACPFAFELKHQSQRLSDLVLKESAKQAHKADYNVVLVGRQAMEETEMIDIESMRLTQGQIDLIRTVGEASRASGNKTIVLVNAGTPVEMPSWINQVDSIMQVWFGGQEGPKALASVIDGTYAPVGKLPFTIPKQFKDNPTFTEDGRRFPGLNYCCYFEEDLQVGYRYYDHPVNQQKVMYPFGYGLSYTTFAVEGISCTPQVLQRSKIENAKIEIAVKVKNLGSFEAANVVQIYVHNLNSKSNSIIHPVKELKAFQKVWVKCEESKNVFIVLDVQKAFEFFDDNLDTWVVQGGIYTVSVATSANDIHSQFSVKIDD